MKTLTLLAAALLISISAMASDPADDAYWVRVGKDAKLAGPAGEAARDLLNYPLLHGELPAEREARVAILKLIAKLRADGTLTPQLEAQLNAQVVQILTAEAARIQANKPQTVIVIDGN